MKVNLMIEARVLPDGKPFKVPGRWGWALRELVRAGENGCTPIDQPAPRWSQYVFVLRRDYNLLIETIHEKHGGQFPGTHARYCLRSEVAILDDSDWRAR